MITKAKRIPIANINEDLLTKLEGLFEDNGCHATAAWGCRDLLAELQAR